jgi:hypothetical protein
MPVAPAPVEAAPVGLEAAPVGAADLEAAVNALALLAEGMPVAAVAVAAAPGENAAADEVGPV